MRGMNDELTSFVGRGRLHFQLAAQSLPAHILFSQCDFGIEKVGSVFPLP